ncbi:unnamed protein product [Polarella glacialis]|uniref:Uncharacterized protein n=1 Tax=Polarella glacialis TaxID=89957 RepID=A0A813JY58_POLGL|nr:unnamed protein product [Polarella glacialis]
MHGSVFVWLALALVCMLYGIGGGPSSPAAGQCSGQFDEQQQEEANPWLWRGLQRGRLSRRCTALKSSCGAACSSRPNSSASSRANSALGRPRTASDRQTLMHRCAQPAAETPRQQQRPEPSLSSLQMHRPPAEGLAPEQWDGKQLDVSSCSSTASALSAKTGSRVAAYVETVQDRGAPTPRGQEFGGGGSLLGTATPGSSPGGHRGVRPNRFLMSDKSPTPFLHEKVALAALRQNLADLKQQQALLQQATSLAAANEARLQQQLAGVQEEMGQLSLEREDVESLFYSDQGLRGVATASLDSKKLQSEEDRRLLEMMQQRVAALTGVPMHAHEINPFLKFDQPAGTDEQGSLACCNNDNNNNNNHNKNNNNNNNNSNSNSNDDLSIGLHLDVNGGLPHCLCSVIVYLNSLEAGGRTVFPCAETGCAEPEPATATRTATTTAAITTARTTTAAITTATTARTVTTTTTTTSLLRCRELGARLASAGHTHTSHSAVSAEAAAELVERASSGGCGLRVAPRRGSALVFFTLLGEQASSVSRKGQDPSAVGGAQEKTPAPIAVDPMSWHGGSAVQGSLGKWTLQIFKEVPLQHREAGSVAEARYIADCRNRLLAAASPTTPTTPTTATTATTTATTITDLSAMD